MRYTLVRPDVRQRAIQAVSEAPDGFVVTIKEATKRREQEEKYHAMIGDIAQQWKFMGQKWDRESAKRLLVDAFSKVMEEQGTPLRDSGRIVPSIDGQRVVQLGVQTRRFSVREASDFIEFLNAFASEHGLSIGVEDGLVCKE